MGQWHISIKGTGQHHNGSPLDAEQMAQKFVAELEAAGHRLSEADVVHGGRTVLGHNGDGGGATPSGVIPLKSVLTDEAGRLSLPQEPETVGGQMLAGLTAMFVILALVIAVPLGCAALQGRAKVAISSCASQAVAQGAADLGPAVGGILSGGAPSWEAQLLALGEKLGIDAVVCAVNAFLSPPADASGKPKLAPPPPAAAVDRASKFLLQHASK